MELYVLFFLSSGLFLGWSLGANDAANIFGTAVGTKMIKFKTASIICSLFVILGAVISGGGTSHTLEELGKINALPGAFMVALSSALSVYFILKYGLTVSTSQAIVGAIIGWNLYCNKPTDYVILCKIILTWVLCPILSAFFAILIYYALKKFLKFAKIHLIRQDAYTRIALIIIGSLGSYALGANNIANVVGVFINDNPFSDIHTKFINISALQVLLFIGAISVCTGVFTYSHKVMKTVGNSLMEMSPLMALVVVLANAIVLLLFSSQTLNNFLFAMNLPTIPLVPVSSTQAVIGAIIGIGLFHGNHRIHWDVVTKIGLGWIITPIISMIICFICLFFLENVFQQVVYIP